MLFRWKKNPKNQRFHWSLGASL